jgi:outer membrane scaffolding protein for murein synthesis (MipA/OmpV family)
MRAALVAAATALLLAPAALCAEPDGAEPAPAPDWTARVAAGFQLRPAFEGARSLRLRPAADWSLTWRRLVLDHDGLGAVLFDRGGLSLTTSLAYGGGRSAGRDAALAGLGNVRGTVQGRAALEYERGPLDMGLAAIQGLGIRPGGLRQGLITTAYIHLGVRLPGGLELAAGPDLTWSNRTHMRTYFGVDAAQSALSGLPLYAPGPSLLRAGATLDMSLPLAGGFALDGELKYRRLLGSAAASPLVQQRGTANQLTLFAALSYKFQ